MSLSSNFQASSFSSIISLVSSMLLTASSGITWCWGLGYSPCSSAFLRSRSQWTSSKANSWVHCTTGQLGDHYEHWQLRQFLIHGVESVHHQRHRRYLLLLKYFGDSFGDLDISINHEEFFVERDAIVVVAVTVLHCCKLPPPGQYMEALPLCRRMLAESPSAIPCSRIFLPTTDATDL